MRTYLVGESLRITPIYMGSTVRQLMIVTN